MPIMITPKWVSTPWQPIAVRNVIGYLLGSLAAPETAGGIYDIGGSGGLCYRDIMRVMAEELGLRRRRVIPVPLLTPHLSSCWIHLVTPLSHKIEPDRKLALRAEMKLPGEALLEFCVEGRSPTQSALRQSALFKPRGYSALACWYAVAPLHHLVFSRYVARNQTGSSQNRGGRNEAPATGRASHRLTKYGQAVTRTNPKVIR